MQIGEAAADILQRLRECDDKRAALVRRLIATSAWWYGHPQGPVLAPKHAERITRGPHGWALELGRDWFLVEKALTSCLETIREDIEKALASKATIDKESLLDKLRRCLTKSVADHKLEVYPSYNADDKGYMHFGNQAISITGFVEEISKMTNIQSICGGNNEKN